MHIFLVPPRQGDTVLRQRCQAAGVACTEVSAGELEQLAAQKRPDAVILGQWQGALPKVDCPILVHSVLQLEAAHVAGVSGAVARICAWPGFWERPAWEVAMVKGDQQALEPVLQAIGLQVIAAPDTDGMIAPGILATLINEAVFTLDSGVASAQDLDTAMQLGTNYPKGPVAWAIEIGPAEVHALLEAKVRHDTRYKPHPQFIQILSAHG